MKTWYYAVCEKCGEGTNIFVSNPSCTAHYLAERDIEIQAWLSKHWNCKLRMVNCETAELDELWEMGFKHIKDGITTDQAAILAYKERLSELWDIGRVGDK